MRALILVKGRAVVRCRHREVFIAPSETISGWIIPLRPSAGAVHLLLDEPRSGSGRRGGDGRSPRFVLPDVEERRAGRIVDGLSVDAPQQAGDKRIVGVGEENDGAA